MLARLLRFMILLQVLTGFLQTALGLPATIQARTMVNAAAT